MKQFKGKTYVDIRKHFKEKNGELIGTAKGVMLDIESWSALKKKIQEIDTEIAKLESDGMTI